MLECVRAPPHDESKWWVEQMGVASRYRRSDSQRAQRALTVSQGEEVGMKERVRDHRQLRVWQAAMRLTVEVYSLTKDFPREQRYGLTHQLQKAMVSVPSNIAEGFGRETTKEYLRFLAFARGSLAEVQTQLEIAKETGCHDEAYLEAAYQQSVSVMKQLNALRRALRGRERSFDEGDEVGGENDDEVVL